MAKFLRILLQMLVFVAAFSLSVRPSWWFMERLWTRTFPSEQSTNDRTFVVLVRQANAEGHYAVALYPNIEDDKKLVTDIEDQDVAIINRDLRASISDQRLNYLYFKVLSRGKEYTDVELEVPPKGDFWSKNSYRIQNGRAYLLREMQFGPIFGLTVGILPIIAGVLAVICCNRLLKLYRQPS
ncbi:MAG: hypothetical protein WBZ01_13465 [Terriglobales bacterium]